jgi:hypothetical protein
VNDKVKKSNKQVEPFDPNKPLKCLRQEKLARYIVENPKATQTQAYLSTYPTNNINTATAEASTILGKPNVRERVLALMSQYAKRDIIGKVAENISLTLDQRENLPVNMDACKTVLKVAGALDEQKQADQSYNPVQIIIERCNISTQPLTIKEDT